MSGVWLSVLIVNVVESPCFTGVDEKKAKVVGEVFFPVHPFCRVKDLKFPFLRSIVRE